MSDPLRTLVHRVAHQLELGRDQQHRMEMCEDIALLIIAARRQQAEEVDRDRIHTRLLGIASAVKVGARLDQVATELAELSAAVDLMADKYMDGVLPE